MSPAHVLEPTYDALKRRLIHGYWSGGFRLEANKIADSLGVSMTPVRDSLYRLTGEQLVDFVHGEGFRVPLLTETKLRDLFGLHNLLTQIAMGSSKPRERVQIASNDIAERTAWLFRYIASRAVNAELITAITLLGDRLFCAWNVDAQIFPAVDSELAEIGKSLGGSSTADALLRRLLVRYHDRRIAEAANYVRILNTKSMHQ